MILPEDLITSVITKLSLNKAAILSDKLMVVPTSEDSSDKNVKPPYLGVYCDFDQEAEVDGTNNPKSWPVSVYVICHSNKFLTAAESFNEAFKMSVKVARLLAGSYIVNNIDGNPDSVYLYLQTIPLLLIKKAADGSAINVQFQYLITDMV